MNENDKESRIHPKSDQSLAKMADALHNPEQAKCPNCGGRGRTDASGTGCICQPEQAHGNALEALKRIEQGIVQLRDTEDKAFCGPQPEDLSVVRQALTTSDVPEEVQRLPDELRLEAERSQDGVREGLQKAADDLGAALASAPASGTALPNDVLQELQDFKSMCLDLMFEKGSFETAARIHYDRLVKILDRTSAPGVKDLDTAECYDCGRPYGSINGFPDLIIPNDAWRRITPTEDTGGLLCPSCICARLYAHGITCEGAFMSGPIETVSRPLMTTMRFVENMRERENRDE